MKIVIEIDGPEELTEESYVSIILSVLKDAWPSRNVKIIEWSEDER